MKPFKLLFCSTFAFLVFQSPFVTGEDPSTILKSELTSTTPGAVFFTPPEGWRIAEDSSLPPKVRIMVVGEGKGAIPPSINLAVEPYQGTLKDYLQIVKSINSKKGAQWNDLGKIKTPAGEGSLSQVDTKMQGTDVRLMHAILKKDGMIYILTAAAPKEEFSSFYKSFFQAMSTLHINEEQKTS